MGRLGRDFGLIITALLVGSAITCGAGIYGLDRLDLSLEGVVSSDMPRLMTVTDLRRRVRMMVVGESDHILGDDAAKASIAKDIAGSRKAIDDLVAKYEPLLIEEDRATWQQLTAGITQWEALDDRVLALSSAHRTDEATALSKTHSKQWEDQIKQLIGHADKQLAAEAAETHRVFARSRWLVIGVFALSALLGLIAGWIIYRRIRSMLREVVTLKDRLVAANESLERTVEERTRTIRAILDHVQFGFFLVRPDLTITEGYTRSLVELLGTTDLAGRRASECLGFTGTRAQDFDIQVAQVFDDILPEELTCAQVPARIEREGRVLRVQASAVRVASGAIAQILFCVSDVTELEAAERQNRDSQTVLRALKNPEPFRRFVADLNSRFVAVREAVQRDDDPRARRELHTIKGNASCYGLADIASRAHLIEEKDKIELVPVIDLEQTFESFLDKHLDVLGIRTTTAADEVYRVERGQLDRLEDTLSRATSLDQARGALREQIARLRWVPVQQLLGPLDAQVANVGNRLGKEVALHVVGGELAVPPAALAPVIAILPHLIRNAIDHGIEGPSARGGKPTHGTLVLEIKDLGEAWQVALADDGRGIDTEKLRARAVERGVLAADARPPDEELCKLIFVSKLSTADEVSDVSGRGEGMAAVAETVERIGGRISIQSVRGAGTRIALDVPKRAEPRAAAA